MKLTCQRLVTITRFPFFLGSLETKVFSIIFPPFQLWQGLFPSVVYLSAGVPSETLFRKGEDKGLLKVISYKQEIRRLPNQISPLNSSSTKFHQIWFSFFCAKLDEVDKSVGARDNLQMVKVANGSLPPKTFVTFAKLLPFRLPSGFFTTAYNNFCPQVLKRFLDENSKQIFISIWKFRHKM